MYQALRNIIFNKRGVGFNPEDFRSRVDHLTKVDLSPFWQAYVCESTVPDYKVESAGHDDSLHRVRNTNRGRLMPMPLDVVAYDESTTEVACKHLVVSQSREQVVEFAPQVSIPYAVRDP